MDFSTVTSGLPLAEYSNWEYPNTEIFKDISIYLKKRNIKSCGIATATYPNYYFQENGKKVRYAKVKVPIELK